MSIYEYLAARSDALFPEAGATLALHCIKYIRYRAEKLKAVTGPKTDLWGVSGKIPFLRHAAIFWGDYAATSFDVKVEQSVYQFLSDSSATWFWSGIYGHDHTYWVDFTLLDQNFARKGLTPLHISAAYGIVDLCRKELAKMDNDPNAKDDRQRTPLMLAAAHGTDSILRLLVSRDNIDLNATDRLGQTALCVAVVHGSIETVRFLLSVPKVNVNLGEPFLHACSSFSFQFNTQFKFEMAKVFLSRKDLDVIGSNNPAWWLLCEQGELETLQMILQNENLDLGDGQGHAFDEVWEILPKSERAGGPAFEKVFLALWALEKSQRVKFPPEKGILDGMWPLLCLVESIKLPEPIAKNIKQSLIPMVRKVFEKHKINCYFRDSRHQSFLHCAARCREPGFLKYLINRGLPVNDTDTFGRTPLHYALQFDDEVAADILLKAGAMVSSKDEHGYLPVHFANSIEDFPKMLQTLLSHGSDVNSIDNYGRTPLHLSLLNKCRGQLEALLTAGASINAVDNKGQSALHYACDNGDVDDVRLLLSSGADLFVKDFTGKTAMHAAARQLQGGQLIELFVEHGVDIDDIDVCGWSALNHATRYGSLDSVVALLVNGANPDAHGLSLTPLATALAVGNEDIFWVLIDAGANPDIRGPCYYTVREQIERIEYWRQRIVLPASFRPPDATDKVEHIRRNMAIRFELMISDSHTHETLNFNLCLQLLMLGNLESARNVLTRFVYLCSGCKTGIVQYVCQQCDARAFCSNCAKKDPKTKSPWCQGHEYIQDPGDGKFTVEEGSDSKLKSFIEYLRGLQAQYSLLP
jgi:ankyrin repeat protein